MLYDNGLSDTKDDAFQVLRRCLDTSTFGVFFLKNHDFMNYIGFRLP
jgi:hypothetical protein